MLSDYLMIHGIYVLQFTYRQVIITIFSMINNNVVDIMVYKYLNLRLFPHEGCLKVELLNISTIFNTLYIHSQVASPQFIHLISI